MAGERGDSIKFLGTAGARFVMIRQVRSSAGAVYRLGGFQLLVDPGPGCLVRCHKSRPKIDPSKLDAVLLTHAHLDHSGDVNVMLEAMSDGGHRPRGRLFAPREALEGDPVVLRYVRDYVGEVQVLHEGGSWSLAEDLSLATPVRHRHGAETYGFRLQTPGLTVSHVADTQYFPELTEHYAPCDVLVLHVVLHEADEAKKARIQHLDVADATRLVREVAPRTAILTHFGMTMVRAKPWEVAERMAEETGREVLAARDGMTHELSPS